MFFSEVKDNIQEQKPEKNKSTHNELPIQEQSNKKPLSEKAKSLKDKSIHPKRAVKLKARVLNDRSIKYKINIMDVLIKEQLRSEIVHAVLFEGELSKYNPGISIQYIKRWCQVTRKQFMYFNSQWSANCWLRNPLAVVPLDAIKEVQRMIVEVKNTRKKEVKKKKELYHFEIFLKEDFIHSMYKSKESKDFFSPIKEMKSTSKQDVTELKLEKELAGSISKQQDESIQVEQKDICNEVNENKRENELLKSEEQYSKELEEVKQVLNKEDADFKVNVQIDDKEIPQGDEEAKRGNITSVIEINTLHDQLDYSGSSVKGNPEVSDRKRPNKEYSKELNDKVEEVSGYHWGDIKFSNEEEKKNYERFEESKVEQFKPVKGKEETSVSSLLSNSRNEH